MLIDIANAVGGYLHDVFIGNADWGILIGYVAQIMFAMRFVVQWIASERARSGNMPATTRRAIAQIVANAANHSEETQFGSMASMKRSGVTRQALRIRSAGPPLVSVSARSCACWF